MLTKNYLLIIDDSLVDENLNKFFLMHQLNIIHLKNPCSISEKVDTPHAILIHWSFSQNQLHVIKQFFTSYVPPLIVINEEFNESHCIYALESGADDFLVKPLHPPELYARINAIYRRTKYGQQQREQEKQVLLFADCHLVLSSRQLFKKNKEVYLSAGEYELLCAFVHRPKLILDREFLSNLTKKSIFDPFDRRIDVQISRLRQKIEVDAKRPTLIKTIRNRGYLFTADVKLANGEGFV